MVLPQTVAWAVVLLCSMARLVVLLRPGLRSEILERGGLRWFDVGIWIVMPVVLALLVASALVNDGRDCLLKELIIAVEAVTFLLAAAGFSGLRSRLGQESEP